MSTDMTDVCVPPNRIPTQYLQEYVAWLRPLPWEIFATLTFAWPVSDPQALKVFRQFIDRIEKGLRGPIALVRGDEKRFSGCGKPGAPRHFHVLMAAHRPLDRRWVCEHWMRLAGYRSNGAGADARIYDASLPGVDYVLKFINQPDGDWDFRNLDLFLPTAEVGQFSRRQRRRLVRHERRMALCQHIDVAASEKATGNLHLVECLEEGYEHVSND